AGAAILHDLLRHEPLDASNWRRSRVVAAIFLNQNCVAPSPAMTKAWLMNSTRYMTGLSANDTLTSNNQGMGMMNLGMAFDGVPRISRDQLEADRFTATGQTRTFQGIVYD